MYKVKVFLLIFSLVLSGAIYVYPQEHKSDGNIEIPPGMEIKKEGDVNLLIPEGAKLIKKTAELTLIEGTDEYASRKFIEIESRFDKIEAEQKALKKEIKRLQKDIEEIGSGAPPASSSQ